MDRSGDYTDGFGGHPVCSTGHPDRLIYRPDHFVAADKMVKFYGEGQVKDGLTPPLPMSLLC